MTTAYTTLLGLALPVQGELTGTWGTTVNNSITQSLDDAVAGTATASVTSGDWTLTDTGSGAPNQARCAILIATGTPGVSRNIIAPARSKGYFVVNQSDAAVVLKGASTTGISIPTNKSALVVWNGSDFVTAVSPSSSGTVTSVAATVPSFLSVSGSPITSSGTLAISLSGTALPVANGGTGATTAAAARTNLEATTVGGNVFTLTNPSAITFPRFNADNTVSALNAADFRTAIGAGSGGGSVTSVSGTGTVSGLTLSGTVTSSGSLTLGGSITGFLPTTGGTMTGSITFASGQTIPATSLKSATTDIAISSATAPTVGQVLTATSSTAATWQTSGAGVGNSEVIVNTGNGFGSTNTLIRRFTTTQSSVGTDITYADSAANGASFTINTTGIYAISYTERFNSASYFGISVNSTQLSTTIDTITATDRVALQFMDNGNGAMSVSVTVRLAAGDVVRAHTALNTSYQSAFAQVFRIRRVGSI